MKVLLAALALCVLYVGAAVMPASAQVQQLDCIFINNLFNHDQLVAIALTDASCGAAASDRIAELRLTDPAFGTEKEPPPFAPPEPPPTPPARSIALGGSSFYYDCASARQ